MSIKSNSTTLMDLGSYKLEVTIHGPPRRAHNPVVIIIPDVGSSIKEWTAVTKMLAESMSVLTYERAGYGQSEAAPLGDSRSPAALAMELHLLLRAAKIAPPYIMVGHSRGASILQEFTLLRNLAQFKGFVFVNTNTGPLEPLVEAKVSKTDLLKLCYGDCHRLGDSSWQALLDEEARADHQEAAEREITEYHVGGESPRSRGLSNVEHEYGRVPLIVLQADIRVDLTKIYNERVRFVNETESQEDNTRVFIERANESVTNRQSGLLQLSGRSKHQYVTGVGQKLHLVVPERVADAVTWILMQYRC